MKSILKKINCLQSSNILTFISDNIRNSAFLINSKILTKRLISDVNQTHKNKAVQKARHISSHIERSRSCTRVNGTGQIGSCIEIIPAIHQDMANISGFQGQQAIKIVFLRPH